MPAQDNLNRVEPRRALWIPLIPKVTSVNPAGTGSDPGIVRQKQTLCLTDHDLYMYEQACIVTLCGGAAPRGAPVRAMHAKRAVPPSPSGGAAAPPPCRCLVASVS